MADREPNVRFNNIVVIAGDVVAIFLGSGSSAGTIAWAGIIASTSAEIAAINGGSSIDFRC
jgi:hypothetical protein